MCHRHVRELRGRSFSVLRSLRSDVGGRTTEGRLGVGSATRRSAKSPESCITEILECRALFADGRLDEHPFPVVAYVRV